MTGVIIYKCNAFQFPDCAFTHSIVQIMEKILVLLPMQSSVNTLCQTKIKDQMVLMVSLIFEFISDMEVTNISSFEEACRALFGEFWIKRDDNTNCITSIVGFISTNVLTQ